MAGYWWQCENCVTESTFQEACDSRGIAHFIWDVLIPSSWDQTKLVKNCKNCGKQSLKITYQFPKKKEKVVFRVIHIVGINPFEDYIPMMWETYQVGYEKDSIFDFKYVVGRSIYGLNKPAVFSRDDLKKLFALFCEKTGSLEFP